MNKKFFVSYPAALEFLYNQLPMYQRQGAAAYKKDLTNTLALCASAGNPHHDLKSIHIAGTNGKGTVSHIIAAGLQANGYKTGVYTSPHYKDFRERIKINGVFIDKRYILHFLNQYYEDIQHIRPSFFEMCVTLAFCYFRDMGVDYAVIETGLGGRLDSTNVITPLLSVITNISYDHMSMLGNTLPEIAGEKAGIIKPGVPVVIGENQMEVKDVFINKAFDTDSKIYFADKHCTVTLTSPNQNDGLNHYNVKIDGHTWIIDLPTRLRGPYQLKNLTTGIFSLYTLSKFTDLDPEKISQHFPNLAGNTKYMGRWQELSTNPLIIADSAHNEAGIKFLTDGIGSIHYENLHIVIGFVNDKDINNILILLPKHAIYYFSKANIPRGLPAMELSAMATEVGLKGKAYSSVRKALAAAKRKADKNDLILVCGSIFVVAEVL